MSQRLRNDTALDVAAAVAAHVSPHLPGPAERTALLCWVHDLVLRAVTEFEERLVRERHRLARTSPD